MAKQVGFLSAAAVLLFGLTVNAGFLAFDAWNYYPLERAAGSSSADASLARWLQAESYLASYVQSNWYRATSLVLIRPPSIARQILQSVREKIAVAAPIDAELTTLEDLVNSTSATAESALNNIARRRDEIKVPPGYDFLNTRIKLLGGLILKKKNEFITNKEERARRDKFETYLENAELSQAANYVLSEEVAQIPGLQEKLADEFRSRAASKLKAKVAELCQSQRPNWALPRPRLPRSRPVRLSGTSCTIRRSSASWMVCCNGCATIGVFFFTASGART